MQKTFFPLITFINHGALLISLYHIVFSHLISSSNINFETYKVLELNKFTVAGFASGFLFLLVPGFLLLKNLSK